MMGRTCIFHNAWLPLLNFSEMVWPVSGLMIGVDEVDMVGFCVVALSTM
jgi:hypothetical protein